MSETLKLAAEMRERAGKGASRAVRRTGRVPAVIYGAGEPATPIHVEEKILVRQLSHFAKQGLFGHARAGLQLAAKPNTTRNRGGSQPLE
jgi:ribosomal protein L25 (general stress protein Ctc)